MSPLLKRKPQTPAEEKQLRSEHEQKVKVVEPIIYTRQRVNVDALSPEECAEMAALHSKARDRQPDGSAREGLETLTPKERRRFVDLLDKALPEAHRERQRALRAERERRELERFAAAQVNQGVPPKLRAGVGPGEVLLPPTVFETGGALNLSDIGVISLLAYSWSSGKVPFVGARWSDNGGALLAPKRLQVVDRETNQTSAWDGLPATLLNLDETLRHLDANGFISAQRDGSGWTIRLGPRLRAWSRGRS
jgi:hypothetical protein